MDVNGAKQLVIKAGIELSETGLIARTWGNVSCRISDEIFAITASGRNYMTLTEEQVIELKISDLSYQGNIKPSSEKQIHRDIYQLKPKVGFVIHTHQEMASAVSAMGLEFFEIVEKNPLLGERIYCADYGLPGTKKLCKNTLEAIKKSKGNAVILKHHGAVCFGENYEEAFEAARSLEEACKTYLLKNAETKLPEQVKIFEDNKFAEPVKIESKVAFWNASKSVLDYAEKNKDLLPYLDDFAQIIGVKAKIISETKDEIASALKKGSTVIVKGCGALCIGRTADEAHAVSILVSKNCKAYFAAQMSGKGKPLPLSDRLWMRQIYLKKYSKLGE